MNGVRTRAHRPTLHAIVIVFSPLNQGVSVDTSGLIIEAARVEDLPACTCNIYSATWFVIRHDGGAESARNVVVQM